jgi:hypothetical protein
MILCKYCYQELKSRGEHVHIVKTFSQDIECDSIKNPIKCDWCDESDSELFECD